MCNHDLRARSGAMPGILFFGLAVLFAFTAEASYAQVPLMVPAPSVEVGPGSGEIVLADVDRDGHLDLVTKHLLERRVMVMLGDGSGNYTPPAGGPVHFDFQPGAMLVGDVNGDETFDMIIARRDDDHEFIHVYLGDGKGGFRPGAPITVSPGIETYKPNITLADVNNDGRVDIVYANGRRNTVAVLFGDGDGAFSNGPTLELEPGVNRYYSGVADVDGDGRVDLVTSGMQEGGGPGRLWIRLGDGKGGFSGRADYTAPLPSGPRLAAISDVNDDGIPDVVLSHVESGVSVMLNHGNAVFKPAAGSPFDVGAEAFAVIVADLNEDALPDLAAATVNSVSLLLGGSGPAFVPAPGSPFAAGPGAYNLCAGDVDEDGKMDLAASSFEGTAVTVLLGQ